ncbi:MAG: cation:proton antiporter, partial [Candidatus Thermoplasmatota archaeon]
IIGGHFLVATLKKLGKAMLIILFGQFFITFIIVTFAIYLWLRDLSIALLFGVLATATAPAGTMAALHDCRAKGTFSTLTATIVGLDDGLGIFLFAFVIAFVKFSLGGTFSIVAAVLAPLIEIFGALALGVVFGAVLSLAAKYIRRREETFIVVIAVVLLCAGLAKLLHLSLILACMTLGAIFINFSSSLAKTSYEILEGVIPPFYIVFFALAGLQLRIDLLLVMGMMGVIYILSRTVGKVGGATLSSRIAKTEPTIQKYLGIALLSQAGVAIALACMTSVELAGYGAPGRYLGALVITTIVAADVIFEIIGPIGVRFAVTKAGESGKSE